MDQLPSYHPDSPEDLLAGLPPALPSDAFQKALLLRTTKLLRRRLRLKRWSLALALVACYAAGAATMRWAMDVPASAGKPLGQPAGEALTQAPSPGPSERPALSEPTPTRPLSAADLEWQALDSREKRPDLFRTAGDRYLQESGDVESATRCYRSFLASSSATETAISLQDNWLLMALKQSKQREKLDAKSRG
jgi:hypothetical protein